MRLWINADYFLSVITTENKYSCQIMELIHENGMYGANIFEQYDKDIVSAVATDKPCKIVNTLQEVFEYHETLLIEYLLEVIV